MRRYGFPSGRSRDPQLPHDAFRVRSVDAHRQDCRRRLRHAAATRASPHCTPDHRPLSCHRRSRSTGAQIASRLAVCTGRSSGRFDGGRFVLSCALAWDTPCSVRHVSVMRASGRPQSKSLSYTLIPHCSMLSVSADGPDTAPARITGSTTESPQTPPGFAQGRSRARMRSPGTLAKAKRSIQRCRQVGLTAPDRLVAAAPRRAPWNGGLVV